MRRMLEPDAVVQHRGPRGREETHLRRQLTALLATAQKFVGQRTIEKDDRFTERQTVLRTAEAQYVDTGTPRDVGRRAIERCHGIGKTRTVELNLHAAGMRR